MVAEVEFGVGSVVRVGVCLSVGVGVLVLVGCKVVSTVGVGAKEGAVVGARCWVCCAKRLSTQLNYLYTPLVFLEHKILQSIKN